MTPRPTTSSIATRDRAVLEEGLFEVGDVVDDHVGARARPGPGCCAAKAVSPLKAVAKAIAAPGARSWTIWAIPRPSSVGFGARGVVEDVDRVGVAAGIAGAGQVAAGDVGGGVGRGGRVAVEGVGEDPDRDPAAVDAEVGAGGGGAELGVALGDDRPPQGARRDRGQRRAGAGRPRRRRRARRSSAGLAADRDRLVAAAGVDDLGAGGAQTRRGAARAPGRSGLRRGPGCRAAAGCPGPSAARLSASACSAGAARRPAGELGRRGERPRARLVAAAEGGAHRQRAPRRRQRGRNRRRAGTRHRLAYRPVMTLP